MNEPTARMQAALADRYRLERELGQGGMATVYLAHDLRHDRKVALKVLRPELAAILGGERFLKEIRLTANLQHPHILPLHDSGEADGLVYYVMPFVEGESLRRRIDREKQLPVDDAIRIAREAADALDYAHRHGVIHRDIKPENILLHDGRAMVADFGIALAVTSAGGGTRMTETGMSLGTPHYMSPEQAMGEREITARSDIYALGCVLYEMLTGEPPFTGPTAQAIVARVVTEDPRPLVLQRKTIPPHVEAVVLRSLEKVPADRFATAGQFAEALEKPGLLPETRATYPRTAVIRPTARNRWTAALPWAVALLAAGTGFWIGSRRREPPTTPAPVVRFDLAFGSGNEPRDGQGSPIALSPDGSRIVYLGQDAAHNNHLFTRLLDRIEPVLIPGSQNAIQPFFSPDGQWLGFFQDGKIRKTLVAGGAVVTICEVPSMNGASWGPSDVIVFASMGRLYRVAAAGGAPVLLAAPDSSLPGLEYYRWPELLPDGRTVLFTHTAGTISRLAAVSLEDTTLRSLEQEGMSPRYVDGGYLVFTQADGTLFAAPFDSRRVRLTGPPQPVTDGARIGPAPVAKVGVSRSGSLAFLGGLGARRELALVDREGTVEVLPLPPEPYRNPRFSPNGRRLAFEIGVGSPFTADIWIYELAARTLSRLTFDSASVGPEWSPDGRRILFTRRRGDELNLHWVAADGSGVSDTLVAGPGIQAAARLSSDGKTLFFQHGARLGRLPVWDIWTMPVDSPSAARPLLANHFSEFNPEPSPDGRWLAYVADETGSNAIYLRGLGSEIGGRVRVSIQQGNAPRWSAGGRELFYRAGDALMVVTIAPGSALSVGTPRVVLRGLWAVGGYGYDVHPGGRQFAVVRQQETETTTISVLLNWFDRLRSGAEPVGSP